MIANRYIGDNRFRLISAIVISIALHGLFLVLPRISEFQFVSGTRFLSQSSFPKIHSLEIELRPSLAIVKHVADREISEPPIRSPKKELITENFGSVVGINPVGFFSADALTRLPMALSEFELDEGGPEFWQGGRILFRLWINDHGIVERVELMQSEVPTSIVLLAERSLRRIPFSPGEIDGKSVSCWSDIVIEVDPVTLTQAR